MRLNLAALLLAEQESLEERVLDLRREADWPRDDAAFASYKPPQLRLGNYAALARLAGVRDSQEMERIIDGFANGFDMGYTGPRTSSYVSERPMDNEAASRALRDEINKEIECGWLSRGMQVEARANHVLDKSRPAAQRNAGSGRPRGSAVGRPRSRGAWRENSDDAPTRTVSQVRRDGYYKWHGVWLPSWVQFLRLSPVRALEKEALGVPQGKYRVIQNLSHGKINGDSINSHIELGPLELVTVRDVLRSVARAGQGSLVWKRDKSSAFRHLPLNKDGVFLTAFMAQGCVHLNFRAVMGARKSVEDYQAFADQNKRINMILMRPHARVSPRGAVWGSLRAPNEDQDWASSGECCDSRRQYISAQDEYIDDGLGHGYKRGTVRAWFEYATYLTLCDVWGLPVNLAPSKSVPPSTACLVLGLMIDTVTMRVSLPELRLSRLKDYLNTWAEKDSATNREVQELIGQLQFACNATQNGHSFLRRLIDQVKGCKFLDDAIQLGFDAKQEIKVWQQFLPEWNGVSLIIDPLPVEAHQILLEMDACKTDGGAAFGTRWFFFEWREEELPWHISIKEFYMAVSVAITFSGEFKGKTIRLQSDNAATVALLNTGRSIDPVMMRLYRELLFHSIRHSFRFTGVWIAGKRNTLGDAISRPDQRHKIWSIRPELERLPYNGVRPTLKF